MDETFHQTDPDGNVANIPWMTRRPSRYRTRASAQANPNTRTNFFRLFSKGFLAPFRKYDECAQYNCVSGVSTPVQDAYILPCCAPSGNDAAARRVNYFPRRRRPSKHAFFGLRIPRPKERARPTFVRRWLTS